VSVLLTPQQPSYALSAQVFDAQGNAVNNAQIVWESSKPASIEVNASGIVTARNFSDAATVRARVGSVVSDSIPVSTADLNNAMLVTKADFSSITSVNPTTLRLVSSDSSKAYSVGQKLVFQDDEIAGKITTASRDTSNRWVLSLVSVSLNEVFTGGVLIGRTSNPTGVVTLSQTTQSTQKTFTITPQSLAAMGISDFSSLCRTENGSTPTFKIALTGLTLTLDGSKISADSARFDLGRRTLYFKINTDLNGTLETGIFEVEGKAPEGKLTCSFPLPAVLGWSGSISYIGSMEVGVVPYVTVELTTSPGSLKVRYANAKYLLKKSFSVGMHYENGNEVKDVNSQSGPGFETVPGEWGASFDFAQTKLEVRLALSLKGKVNVFRQDYGGSLAEASGYGNLAVSLASADVSGFNPFWNSPDLGMSNVIFPKMQGDLGFKIEAGGIFKPLVDRINDTTRFWGFTLANPEVTLVDVKTSWLSPPSLSLDVVNDPSCASGKRLNTTFKPGVGMAGADTIEEIVYLAQQRDVSPNFALLGRNKLTSGNSSTLCWQSPSSTRPSASWEVRSVALSSVFVQRFVSSPLSLDTTSSAGCSVAAVAVTPTNLQLNVGQTQILSARVDLNPPNCANPPSTTLSWTSGDSSKVTVDSSGKVTGVAATGQPVVVTASAGGKSGSSSVSVSGPAAQACVVQSVTVSPSTVQLQVGQTAQLTATPSIGPSGCTGTPNTAVSWSSSDSSRAAVSSTGVVTAVTPTPSPVTLTATVGGKSDSSNATVTAAPQAQYTYLIDALNNLCLTVSGASSADNTPILALACQAGDNRRYTLKATSDYVQVVAKHSGKCFGLSGNTGQEGARVVQVTCDGGSVAQRFTPVRETSGLLKLVSKVNGMCVDVMMPFNVVSGEVGLFNCHAGNNQRFRDPVDPPTSTNNTQGTLGGRVLDAVSKSPVSGASVLLSQGGGAPLDVQQTTTDGTYGLQASAGSGYSVRISRTGYQTALVNDVELIANQSRFLETLLFIDSSRSGNGVLSGQITNSLTGSGLEGAKVRLRPNLNTRTGTVLYTATANASGQYSFPGIPSGYYTAEATQSGFVSGYFNVVSIGGTTTSNQNFSISPQPVASQLRVVLTWGQNPADLDSHLTGPNEAGGRFHIFYKDKGGLFTFGQTQVILDVDDTDSYGPETITLTKPSNGLYRYSVHDYTNKNSTNNTDLSNSQARVRVFSGGDSFPILDLNVPVSQIGNLWTVFEIENGSLKTINTIGNVSDAFSVRSRPREYQNDAQQMTNLPAK